MIDFGIGALRNVPAQLIYLQRHCEYQAFWYVQVYGDTHAVGPVHPLPPHWPYLACVSVVAVGVADVAVLVFTLDVVRVVAVVLEEEGTVVPAAAANRLWTVLYAGLVVRLAQ